MPRSLIRPSSLAAPLLVALAGGCDEPSPPHLSADPATAAASTTAAPSGVPIDPGFYEEDGCEALTPPKGGVVFHLEHASLDEVVNDVLPRALGSCVDATPSLLHRYRCLEIDDELTVGTEPALPAVRRLLAPFDLEVERTGSRYRLTAPPDGGPCPDGG